MKNYPPIKAITIISVFASELYNHEILKLIKSNG